MIEKTEADKRLNNISYKNEIMRACGAYFSPEVEGEEEIKKRMKPLFHRLDNTGTVEGWRWDWNLQAARDIRTTERCKIPTLVDGSTRSA